MRKSFKNFFAFLFILFLTGLSVSYSYAADVAAGTPGLTPKGMTLWELMVSGGVCMLFLGLLSIAATASIIYHFLNVRLEKLVPQDTVDNIVALLKKKELDKASAVCQQQPSLISTIALKGIKRAGEGKIEKIAVEEALQNEGKAGIERLWRNLTYLGDIAMIAPMLGLLGTIIGMIEAFHYFKLGNISPALLTQGLAKAMINTAAGLIIAVPCLVVYSYFRGQVSMITSKAEAALSDIAHSLTK